MTSVALPAFESNRCHLFALGRNAMYAACQLLGLRAGDEVLTPAFDCDGTLQPFRVLGLRLRFYRSDPLTLAADVEDLRRRIRPQTKLVHVISQFGFPQPWDALLVLRRETGIPILEDSAYSLLSLFDGRPAGTFGDAAIFSLRKTLGLVDGGLLRINRDDLHWQPPVRWEPWVGRPERLQAVKLAARRLGYGSLPLALRWRLRRFTGSQTSPPPLYDDPRRGIPAQPGRDAIGREFACNYLRPMSRLARLQLEAFSGQDIEEIARSTREHYVRMVSQVRDLPGVRVLWPVVPEGVVPFSVCLLMEAGRDRCLAALRDQFGVMAWPTLPGAVLERLDEFPEVERLGRHWLQITLPADRVRTEAFRQELEALVCELGALLRETVRAVPRPQVQACSAAV